MIHSLWSLKMKRLKKDGFYHVNFMTGSSDKKSLLEQVKYWKHFVTICLQDLCHSILNRETSHILCHGGQTLSKGLHITISPQFAVNNQYMVCRNIEEKARKNRSQKRVKYCLHEESGKQQRQKTKEGVVTILLLD